MPERMDNEQSTAGPKDQGEQCDKSESTSPRFVRCGVCRRLIVHFKLRAHQAGASCRPTRTIEREREDEQPVGAA